MSRRTRDMNSYCNHSKRGELTQAVLMIVQNDTRAWQQPLEVIECVLAENAFTGIISKMLKRPSDQKTAAWLLQTKEHSRCA